MIYGNRFYEFNKPIQESVEEPIEEYKVTYESLLDGFEAVAAVAEATNNDEILESYNNLLEENYVEVLEEGANREYADIMKEHSKTYKEQLKDAKSFMVKKDFSEAKKKFKEAEKTSDDFLKDMEKVNSDNLGSLIAGDAIIIMIRVIYNILLGNLATVFKVAKFLKAAEVITKVHKVAKISDHCISLIGKIRELLKDKSKLAKSLNSYRARIAECAQLMKDIAKAGQFICDKLIESEKKKVEK